MDFGEISCSDIFSLYLLSHNKNFVYLAIRAKVNLWLFLFIGISVSIETLGEAKDKFLVQVVSHSSKEGAKTGTRMISIVDMNLHTLEENRSE